MKVSFRNHKLVIETPEACTVTIVRIDGITFPTELHVGCNVVELQSGFYVVAGKKVVL